MLRQEPAHIADRGQNSRTIVRTAIVKALVLLGLLVWAFYPQLRIIVRSTWVAGPWTHTLALPVVLGVLIYRRRALLTDNLARGSMWGAVILIGGVVCFALSTWPFNYGYFQLLSVLPVLTGGILAIAGWRVVKHCIPLLLVIMLGLPIGPRKYAALIIRPETITMKAARIVLDSLPGVDVSLRGPDLHFVHSGEVGTIALGESNRGVALLGAYALIGVFVVFVRVRPFWQITILAIAALPIVFICNFCRIITWGIVTIYFGSSPTSAIPRSMASVISLLAAYLLFGGLCVILSHILVNEGPLDECMGTEIANV